VPDTTDELTFDAAPGSLARLGRSWKLSLQAANRAPSTITGYTGMLGHFVQFLDAHDLPTAADAITCEHVERYMVDVLGRSRPSTALTRYKGLSQFYKWATAEGEVTDNPMTNFTPPAVAEDPVRIFTPAESTNANSPTRAGPWTLTEGFPRGPLGATPVTSRYSGFGSGDSSFWRRVSPRACPRTGPFEHLTHVLQARIPASISSDGRWARAAGLPRLSPRCTRSTRSRRT
jgi:hypothetical protein